MYNNQDFYDSEGQLDVNTAKEAYYEMMEKFNYPIPERLKGDDFMLSDFGLGKFTEVGMAGMMWINNQEHKYFGYEIYLLPNQMLTEHWHEETKLTSAKYESWHVRHGSLYAYGEGEPTEGSDGHIPENHRKCLVARCGKHLKTGEVAALQFAGEKHWMLAGSKGAIVTEYGTYHDGDGVKFSHPGISF